MNKQDCFELGYDRGVEAAEFGTEEAKTQDEFLEFAFEAEENSRQFSPFEFYAHDINCEDNADELWEEYDRGVAKGIQSVLESIKVK